MSDEAKLRQQMANIGARYLARTLGELPRIRELASQVQSGSVAQLKDLEHAAHKIHGSGAMFGFDQMSDRAGEIEHIAGFLARRETPEHLKGLTDEELRRRLGESVDQLERLTHSAARDLGIDTNAS